jgi:hypothetical protein
MVEPASCGPGRHPRNGRGEQAVTAASRPGGRSQARALTTAQTSVACSACVPANWLAIFPGRTADARRKLLAVEDKPCAVQPACMPPKYRAFFGANHLPAITPGRAVGIFPTPPAPNPPVPLRERVAEIGNPASPGGAAPPWRQPLTKTTGTPPPPPPQVSVGGWVPPENSRTAADPTPPSREFRSGFQKFREPGRTNGAEPPPRGGNADQHCPSGGLLLSASVVGQYHQPMRLRCSLALARICWRCFAR